MTCLQCKEPIRYDDSGVLAEVTGFSRRRKGGGQNHVLLRRETGRYVCGQCAIKLTASRPGQGSLL